MNAWVHTNTKPQISSTRSRSLGWRIHGSVEDTKLSTNKQHSVSGVVLVLPVVYQALVHAVILCILHGVARAGFPDGNVLVLERRRTDLAHSAAAWDVICVAYVDSAIFGRQLEWLPCGQQVAVWQLRIEIKAWQTVRYLVVVEGAKRFALGA